MDEKAPVTEEVAARANGKPEPDDEIDLGKLAEEEMDLELDRCPIKLKRNGKLEQFEMREMDGVLRGQYNEAIVNKYTTEVDGKTEVTKRDGLWAEAVHRSIFNSEGKLAFTFEEVQAFPGDVQFKLYLAARKLSKLDRKSQKEVAKNS